MFLNIAQWHIFKCFALRIFNVEHHKVNIVLNIAGMVADYSLHVFNIGNFVLHFDISGTVEAEC